MAQMQQLSFDDVRPVRVAAAPPTAAIRPARGIILGLGLSAVAWTTLFLLVRPLFS